MLTRGFTTTPIIFLISRLIVRDTGILDINQHYNLPKNLPIV